MGAFDYVEMFRWMGFGLFIGASFFYPLAAGMLILKAVKAS